MSHLSTAPPIADGGSPEYGNLPIDNRRLSRIFGKIGANTVSTETRRQQKAAVGGPFRHQKINISRIRTGWLATQCGSHPPPGEFPANREFYREICDFEASGDALEQETTVPQRLFGQFPTQINKENISTNREFLLNNREFHTRGGKRPFLALLFA